MKINIKQSGHLLRFHFILNCAFLLTLSIASEQLHDIYKSKHRIRILDSIYCVELAFLLANCFRN